MIPLTAMVIDDDLTNVTLISHMLRKIDGVTPQVFTDPVAALHWCERHQPDIVLLDYMMPELDGLQFIERFRRMPGMELVPIIMVTAALEREVRLKALELSANDFLTKPLDSVELTARVRNMLTLRKTQLRLDAASDEKLRKLSQVAEQSPNSIIISDRLGTIEYVNAAFTEITGYSSEECVGRKIGFLKSGKTPPETYDDLWKTLGDGRVWHGEFINRHKNGELINDLAFISPIRQADGQITHYLSIQQDITDKKRIEQELDIYRSDLEDLVLQRTNELLVAKMQAETANRAKSDFLANMSHEIRTPMNAIIGFNALCLRTDLDSRQRDYLTKLGSAAQSLLHLINEILDHSKIEAGQLTLESIPVDPLQIIDSVVSLVSTQAADKGLKIRVKASPLPESLLGDPLRLQQVLLNLCSNAVKFSSGGEVLISCERLDSTASSTTLCFAVEDSGIGIARQEIDFLFQPFTQADASTTRRFGGTGLGLSICKSLVEKMRGRIWVESELGRGSKFSFTAQFESGLDVVAESNVPQRALEVLNQEMARLKGVRVLLVEDNPFNQQVASELLADAGLVVDVAENGQVAIELVERHAYDAVLMDIQMPVMDGYMATRHIRKDPRFKELPIIALTASVLRSERDLCLQAGMNARLTKPIVPEELYGALLQWVTHAHSQDDVASSLSGPSGVADLPVFEGVQPEYPGINPGPVLQRMRGNVAAFKRLLAIFCEQFQDAAKTLTQALESGDYESARRLAHTVKGSAGTVGAEHLQEISSRLEMACKNRDVGHAELLADFETALAIVIAGHAQKESLNIEEQP